MGLRINTNVAALNTARVLRESTLDLNRSLERLSSGLRINRARDDAAGLFVAENFQSIVRGTQVAQRNAQDGINLVQTAEGALSEVTSILQRMRELAVQSLNGTLDTDSRNALDEEFDQIRDQIDEIANDTEFNNVSILDGTPATITLQVGPDGGQTIDVSLTDANVAALGISTSSISSVVNAGTALTAVDAALTTVNTARTDLGAVQNRLEFTINVLAIQEENATASESAIRDADIAQETIRFTRNQILVSAGTSVLAQANIVPQTALTLLGQ